MAEFATLAQLKSHLDITRPDNDGELGDMLDAAEDVVADLVGTFSSATIAERATVHDGTVILGKRPVSDVLLHVDAVPLSGFTVNAAAGLVYDVPASGRVDVTYKAGDGTMPAAVKLATLIIAGHLWETQRGTSPTALTLQGEEPAGFGPAGFAIPNRAKELLQPYLRSASQVA